MKVQPLTVTDRTYCKMDIKQSGMALDSISQEPVAHLPVGEMFNRQDPSVKNTELLTTTN